MKVYICDPDRILINTNIGSVQAWRAEAGAISVGVCTYTHINDRASYIQQTLNMTAEDARDLALVLIEAADHADKVKITASPVEEAA